MSYVGLGIPWVALGRDRLFGDSGFLCIYEPLMKIYEQTGHKSLIYLDQRHAEKFESNNDPEKTGVYPIYSAATRNPSKGLDQPLDDITANTYLDGKRPIDYIITNKGFVLPHLAGQALTSKGPGIPVTYVCLNAGKDAVVKPVSKVKNTLHAPQVHDQNQFYLYMEAASYLTASYVIWTTEDQRRRGMEIARRFLSPVEVARLTKRSMVNGCGIYDGLAPHAKTDDEVRKFFKAHKPDFSVTFLGRVTGNKNVGYILDTMMPLFARHNIRLNMKTSKALPSCARFEENDDPMNIVSTEMFSGGFASRDEYASRLLPSLQCLFYASIAEGYCITPREAIYIGVPVLLPRRPWSVTAVGESYPFLYDNQTEAFALIKAIEEGRIPGEMIDRFLAVRANPQTCEFLSSVSAKLFGVCKGMVDDRTRVFGAMAHSKLEEAFDQATPVGTPFLFREAVKAMQKFGVTVGEGNSKRASTSAEVYAFVRERLTCLDPAEGLFVRNS